MSRREPRRSAKPTESGIHRNRQARFVVMDTGCGAARRPEM